MANELFRQFGKMVSLQILVAYYGLVIRCPACIAEAASVFIHHNGIIQIVLEGIRRNERRNLNDYATLQPKFI
jgi:hypothetical protein